MPRYTVMYKRLATGWTVRGSNPNGGDIFCAFFVHTAPEAHPAPCTMCTMSFLVEKRPKRRADQPPPLVGLPVWEWDGAVPLPPLYACIGLSWGDHLYNVQGAEFIRPTSLVTSCRLPKHMELGWLSETPTSGLPRRLSCLKSSSQKVFSRNGNSF